MTVASATSRVSYTGDGATSAYAFTTKIFDDDDLLVTVRDTATPPTETTLTKTTHYTVTGVGSDSGGTITLVATGSAWLTSGTAYLKSSYTLVIRRRPALLQEQPLRNLGSFYPNIYEDALDYLLMKVQGLRDELDRTIRAPECDSTALTTRLVAAASRASKYLGFDSSGQATVLDAPANTTAVSVFGASLIDDADAATARTTLGATAGVWPATMGGTGLSALGTAYQRLRVNSGATALEYVNNNTLVTQTKTTTYTALVSDDVIFASTSGGAWSLALPAAAGCNGKMFVVKKTTADFNALTIDPNGAETIGGSATTTLDTEGESLAFVSDGTNWQIIRRVIPSKWTTYTPTGSWSANTTYVGRWRRVGDSMEVEGTVSVSGAPTAASLTVNLPSGPTVDTAKLEETFSSDGTGSEIGHLSIKDVGTQFYVGQVSYNNTTSVAMNSLVVAATAVGRQSVTNLVPMTWANGDAVHFSFQVPISGWNS